MFSFESVKAKTIEICQEVLQISILGYEEELNLSSIQTLRALSRLEKDFGIEVEDNIVFHGLFNSAKTMTQYICKELNLDFQ